MMVFFIVSSERFTENDVFLAREIKALGKRFLYIRSKIDNDIRNEQEDRENPMTPEEIMAYVKSDTIKGLQKEGIQIESTEIFTINAKLKACQRYEFLDTLAYILDNLPQLKNEVMLMSIDPISSDIVDRNVTFLRRYVFPGGASSALALPISVSGIGNEILFHMYMFFKEKLGLDDTSLERIANRYGVDVEIFRQHFLNPNLLTSDSSTYYFKLIPTININILDITFLRKHLGVPSIVLVTVEFVIMTTLLWKLLNKLAVEAKHVLQKVS